jgi:signal transduction histidine kinase
MSRDRKAPGAPAMKPSLLQRLLKIWLLALLLGGLSGQGLTRVWASPSAATPAPPSVALLEADTRQLNLAEMADVLEDPGGQLTLADIQRTEHATRFRRWTAVGSDLNFGFTGSTYWIRVALRRSPEASADWLLEIPYAKLDELAVYAPGLPPVLTGSHHPLSERPYRDHFFVLPLQATTQASYVYLRAQSSYALTVPMVVWQPRALQQSRQETLMLQFLYFGGLLSLLIYNLFLFISLRDVRFAFYALYALTFGWGMLAGNGFGRLFVWPDSPAFEEISQSGFLALASLFSVLFSRDFLQTPLHFPRSDLLLKGCGSLFLALAGVLFASVWWPGLPVRLSNQCLMYNALIMVLLLLYVSAQALRRGHTHVRFFVLAWGVLLIGVLGASLRALGWLPTVTFTSYILQISSALEMLLLALALADMIHLERASRLKAQEEALKAQHEALQAHERMLETLRSSEESLERAVHERTEQLEMALRKEKDLLTQYVRFGSMISHEFRNPLGIIDSQVSLMRKEHELGRSQIETRLAVIGSATRRLVSMFERWLQTDRLSHSLQQIAPQPLFLSDWLKEALEACAHTLGDHPIDLQLQDGPVPILGDAHLLEMALSNLLDNACKYSEPSSPIRLETVARPGFVGFAVTDQGKGIPPAYQAEVFREFFRLAPEGAIRGMGLGLPLVKRIVDAHGGEVQLDSTVGCGSRFCIWLPEMKRP